MACSADRNTQIRYRGQTIARLPVYTGVTIYNGSLVALDSTGYAHPAADTSGYKVIGVAEEQVVAGASASGTYTIRVRTGVNKFANSATHPVITATLATAAGYVYVEDDCTVAASGTNSICAGIVTEIDADGGIWVDVSNYSPYAAVIAVQGAYTQTYSTASKTVPAVTTHAITDSSGGTASTSAIAAETLPDDFTDSTTGTAGHTLAAGAGVSHIAIPVTLSKIADGDLVTAFTPGYKFKILGIEFVVTTVASTAAKAATLNLEIGTTNVTGGVLSLTTAACDTLGEVTAATAVTAANTGSATDTVSVEASATTTFVEGEGVLMIRIQNMDTADAIASLAAEADAATAMLTLVRNAIATLAAEDVLIKADVLADKKNLNAIVDDLQATAIVG
jgi:hypothetical protein